MLGKLWQKAFNEEIEFVSGFIFEKSNLNGKEAHFLAKVALFYTSATRDTYHCTTSHNKAARQAMSGGISAENNNPESATAPVRADARAV
ncbi:hypothetical protein [Thalassobius sp. Cn5-15]|uniref:hypothetical protein n=1 Tax=Thalassobius sp. Cn5-15 TaxID=2917763 RepID=UPI001EF30FAA|nr:hypothetical protein [Thalassobius sp. Cn5-15]MCG7493044.1 hypothetical protein [Thalassobius sp. Cn5-15]